MRGLIPSVVFTEPAAQAAPPAAPAEPAPNAGNQTQAPQPEVDDVILDEEGQALRSEDDTMIRAE